MAEHPILFSGPMIRAILDGRKTVTRRIVKLDVGGCIKRGGKRWHPAGINAVLGCPYGQVGDELWVRETFSGPYCMETSIANAAVPPSYWAPGTAIWYWADGNPPSGDWTRPRPSIHMPRWASRITLRITDVRVERLKQITETDARAEGIRELPLQEGEQGAWWDSGIAGHPCRTPRAAFATLWDSLNAKRGAGWDVNPWVFVIEFQRA